MKRATMQRATMQRATMQRATMQRVTTTAVLFCCATALAGCADPATGSLNVLVEAEDVIVDGLVAGDGLENINDGWNVEFDRYVIVLGAIDLELANDPSTTAAAEDVFAIDLASVAASGESLWQISALETGRWNFGYAVLGAADDAVRHDSVRADDFTMMQADDLSHIVVGKLERPDGVSCPPATLATPPDALLPGTTGPNGNACFPNPAVTFSFAATAKAAYGPCSADGIPGVAVSAGGIQTAAITIHGDHLFFNGFPEGSEGGVSRLAQWLADCDLDLDGEVTQAELEAIRPSDLPALDQRFQLGGSPISPLDSMWTYVRAQLMTQGHFQGEGECPLIGLG